MLFRSEQRSDLNSLAALTGLRSPDDSNTVARLDCVFSLIVFLLSEEYLTSLLPDDDIVSQKEWMIHVMRIPIMSKV